MEDIGFESFVIGNNICLYNRKKLLLYGIVRYGTLVYRSEEEKYGTVRYGQLGSTATP